MKRWGGYLRGRKRFLNRILLVIPSVGVGDVLLATPVIDGLRRDHPTATIAIETRFPEVFENNPAVQECVPFGKANKVGYDRVVKLDPNFADGRRMAESCADIAATTLSGLIPSIYLTQEEISWAFDQLYPHVEDDPAIVLAVALRNDRPQWQGKNLPAQTSAQLIRGLRDAGFFVVEVGKGIEPTGVANLDLIDKTSLRQLFAIMYMVGGFVGIDSLPFHVAQAFGKRSFVLFGATDPKSYIVQESLVTPIVSSVSCAGCYQVKKHPGFNTCVGAGKDEDCMRDGFNVDEILKRIREEKWSC